MKSIPLPKSLSEQAGDGNHQATFIIEPLYPGYGMTIGNTLRRVLLSSLPGAAITAVKVEGADHEFSGLPHVKEDLVDIILNLKQVRLKLHGNEPVTVQLKVSGAKTVTAADIAKNAEVEVVSPDQVIATLTDKAANLDMELTVAPGRGYIPVEAREKEKLPIGTIAIDAIYTPVKNVNFDTEHVRVEQMTNFDKLSLHITTDGSITPAEALRQAAEIMVAHFQFVLDGPTPEVEPIVIDEAATEPTEPAEPVEAPADPVAEEKPKKKAAKKKKDETEGTED